MVNIKIKRISHTICGFMLCTILASCSQLKSEYVPGAVEAVEEKDLAGDTIWIFDGNAYSIHRIGSNEFVAATVQWDKKTEAYRMESFPLVLSKLDENYFLSARQQDGLYAILRAVPTADSDRLALILHYLDKDAIKADMKGGLVEAGKTNGNFILEGSKREQDEYLRKNIARLFPVNQAAIARLIYESKPRE